ncbi:inorganic diphosphatase [Candidatus Micrarchaeota archaeon]|nr:inorganic diphosphatase [Candidatus Micrarchaeota archaeon]
MNLVKKIPWGKEKEINVVIEIPRGSSNKYEYDEKNEYFRLDRTLHTAVFYPFDYGFMPQSKAGDGDALDVIVLTETPTFPGCVIRSRPVGLLRMEDQSGEDIKIITVPASDIEPRKAEINDVADIPEHQKKEIIEFMRHYKALEPHKWTKVHGFENAERAYDVIKESANSFKKRANRRK